MTGALRGPRIPGGRPRPAPPGGEQARSITDVTGHPLRTARHGTASAVAPRLRRLVLVAAAAAQAALGGCGESARPAIQPERGLHDPVIQTRLEALREVERTKDRRHVPDLIEMLDDEDPGIRLLAGATLREITGRDTGYRAYAGPEERRRQMEDWRRWWRETSGGGAPSPASSAAPASPGSTGPAR